MAFKNRHSRLSEAGVEARVKGAVAAAGEQVVTRAARSRHTTHCSTLQTRCFTSLLTDHGQLWIISLDLF